MPDTLPTLSRQTLTTVTKQHNRVLIITTVIRVLALQEKLAKERAQQQQAEIAAKNQQPVSFSGREARWKSRPNTQLPPNLIRILNQQNLTQIGVRLNVSAKGKVIAVNITQSSGNSQIDSIMRQRLLSGRLYPFMRDGVPVAGIGNLTINLQ